MSKRVTITDLARELGLAKSAVSYALNDQPGVSAQTRARVKALARRRGWHPSVVARALAGGRSAAIGVVLRRDPALLGEEPWYPLVLAGMEQVLLEADVTLMLRMVGDRDDMARRTYRQWAEERRVDGVVLFDGDTDDARLPLLRELDLPYVLVGFSHGDDPAVLGDSVAEAATIGQALVDCGLTKVLFIGGLVELAAEKRRRAGLTQYAVAHGLDVQILDGDYTTQSGRALVQQVLASGSIPQAVVCSNDLMAVGALAGLRASGIDVPGQTSLIAWDDSIVSRTALPPLTALNRDPMAFGRSAARLLLAITQGSPTSTRIVQPARLIVRDSLRQVS
ncbi:MAG: LacI family transcriptional regulator [Propionibacteriaceae bacterium]|jgi:DNA-binding LacI/PurR family transcriptional regulator|nr:LacI family transcriptional regulator [Propionibacteriaceae bacterium]